MRTTVIIFIATILICSCSTDQNREVVYYIVKHPKIDKNNEEPPIDILRPFYGNYNFVLPDNSRIFYHKKNKHHWCGYGLDFDKPFKIELVPQDLKQIKTDDLNSFLKSIPDSIISERHFYVSISSPVDTIRNSAFKTITDFLKSKNIKVYNVRNLTEEEKYVMTAKLEYKKYEPAKLEWTIGFGDTPHFDVPSESTKEK